MLEGELNVERGDYLGILFYRLLIIVKLLVFIHKVLLTRGK